MAVKPAHGVSASACAVDSVDQLGEAVSDALSSTTPSSSSSGSTALR
ncbi:MAG: hypothetical protein ACLTMP_06045 [Eggerthella lenta]